MNKYFLPVFVLYTINITINNSTKFVSLSNVILFHDTAEIFMAVSISKIISLDYQAMVS